MYDLYNSMTINNDRSCTREEGKEKKKKSPNSEGAHSAHTQRRRNTCVHIDIYIILSVLLLLRILFLIYSLLTPCGLRAAARETTAAVGSREKCI